MKPYGVNKKFEIGFEDVLAIQIAGRKSSTGKFPGKSGEYHSYTRNTETRNKNRRYFKKSERHSSKIKILQYED